MAKSRALAQLLEEQNKLAQAKALGGVTVRVVVLMAGVYNGARHKALPPAAENDVIEVAGGPYAESLIRDGFVRLYGGAR
jgi:hypothetical protein